MSGTKSPLPFVCCSRCRVAFTSAQTPPKGCTTRHSPVRRAISRIEKCCRNRQRRMTLRSSMTMTSRSLASSEREKFEHGPILERENRPRLRQFSVEINMKPVKGRNEGQSRPFRFQERQGKRLRRLSSILATAQITASQFDQNAKTQRQHQQ